MECSSSVQTAMIIGVGATLIALISFLVAVWAVRVTKSVQLERTVRTSMPEERVTENGMSLWLANELFANVVNKFFPETGGVGLEDQEKALTTVLSNIKKAHAEFIGRVGCR